MSPKEKLYVNGTVVTMDDDLPHATAVLTRGDKIAAVGSLDLVRAKCTGDAETIDLQGRTLMPAFIDPHGHFPDSGFIGSLQVDLASPPRGNCRTMSMALDRLAEKTSTTPKGDWVLGVLFDNTGIAERRMPTREELDGVSQDHPIWVMHASGHNGVANTAALRQQGIDETVEDPLGGRFGRDKSTGTLTGLIEGLSAMGVLGESDFQITPQRFVDGFRACRDEYLSHGVTFAQNAWVNRKMLTQFAGIAREGDPGIDLLLLPAGELEPKLSNGSSSSGWPAGNFINWGPRKLFIDGAFQLQTALLSAPYLSPIDAAYPCGTPYADTKELTSRVCLLHDMGFQIHCHCNGDAATDIFLDAVSEAQRANPRDDHRHTIIHGQVLRDDQLRRMKELGVTVTFFVAHVYYWGDRHYDSFLGPERAERISPCASAARHGVRYTIHNDATVTPTRPIHLANCAVTRKTYSGRVLGAAERISVESALRAQTIDAAWQVFREHERGSITEGKLADLIVLSDNPIEGSVPLSDIVVEETVRRGQTVFRRSTQTNAHTRDSRRISK